MLHPIHSPAPGFAPPRPPRGICANAVRGDAHTVSLIASTDNDQRCHGLRVDFIDHWRMSAMQVHHFTGRMWSYWLRNPNLVLAWMVGFTWHSWDAAVKAAREAPHFNSLDAVRQSHAGVPQLDVQLPRVKGYQVWSMWLPVPFTGVESCDRATAFSLPTRDGYSAARRWNAHAARRQSAVLRLLLAAAAHAERNGGHDRSLPSTLCGMRFDRVAQALASEDVSSQRVVAADVLTMRSERACEMFTMLEVRIERLAPPECCGCLSASALSCLVLFLMGDHVVARAWAAAAPGGDGTFAVVFTRAVPSGGALSPRIVTLWVAPDACVCGVSVAPCGLRPRAFARMIVGRDSMFSHPWMLTDDAEHAPSELGRGKSVLITCFGATHRFVSHVGSDFCAPDTELVMLELDEVVAMIKACGDVGALLATRKKCGRWRLPPGACGCGCRLRGQPAGQPCTVAHIPEVDNDETLVNTQARLASYLGPSPLSPCSPSPARAEQTRHGHGPVITVGDRRIDLTDAAMDAIAYSVPARAFLTRVATSAM